MSRFRAVSEPTIITVPKKARLATAERIRLEHPTQHDQTSLDSGPLEVDRRRAREDLDERPRMTFTGAIGAICMFPLRAIIHACVALRIHPNTLTLVGVIINVFAASSLAYGLFMTAFIVMIVANIFDFIDGKVAHQLGLESAFGAFWDSTLDRFSDLALLTGLIYLYSRLGRSDYVMVAALTLIFSIMTSYARARAESLVEKCKVGFMERPERIVLLMIGASTNRMAAVLWVILVLSIVTVADRIYYTYLMLNRRPMPTRSGIRGFFNRAFFWTDDRATIAYDLWVTAILAFVWMTPPDWLGDPMATGPGLIGLLRGVFGN
jgi:CDP-diacylglycerol---glycerol-3-phosphate 3-phosphatidyltransferase